jgi:hypothetical protein
MRNGTPDRFHPTHGETLSDMLRRYSEKVRFRKNKRQAAISRDAWVDESYVSRLISGERVHPSRDALILLGGWGLELDVHEIDELIAAEYKPLVLPASLR